MAYSAIIATVVVSLIINDCSSGVIPLYRYWNSGNMDHLYTNKGDASVYPTYEYEGVACWLATEDVPNAKALHRYYNSVQKDHYYSRSSTFAESRTLWKYEHIVGYCFENQYQGTVPLHRYFRQNSDGNQDNFYTLIKDSYEHYTHESVTCYVYSHFFANRQPFYRYWSSSAMDHFYTTNGDKSIYSPLGMELEGIECWLPFVSEPNAIPLYRYYNEAQTDHYYSTSSTFAQDNPGWSWLFEGKIGYCFETEKSGTVPFHRYFRQNSDGNQDNFYTVNKASYNHYSYQGVSCYVYPPSSAMEFDELALRFAPILKFDNAAGGKGYPMSAQEYYQERQDGNAGRIENTVLSSDNCPVYYATSSCNSATALYKIEYWFFYGYQHECASGGDGSHDGDWERIVVHISAMLEIYAVTYYQHGGWYTAERPAVPIQTHQLIGIGEHPIVYVGKNAHGSYNGGGGLGGCLYFHDYRNPGPMLDTSHNLINLKTTNEEWFINGNKDWGGVTKDINKEITDTFICAVEGCDDAGCDWESCDNPWSLVIKFWDCGGIGQALAGYRDKINADLSDFVDDTGAFIVGDVGDFFGDIGGFIGSGINAVGSCLGNIYECFIGGLLDGFLSEQIESEKDDGNTYETYQEGWHEVPFYYQIYILTVSALSVACFIALIGTILKQNASKQTHSIVSISPSDDEEL